MTNTLHRRGSQEELENDFVVFALPKLDIFPLEELIKKLKAFTKICLRHGPINMGKLEDFHLSRVDPTRIEEDMQDSIALTAVYDNTESVAALINDLKKADLKISINISGLLEATDRCCKQSGIKRHSVEQSIGVFGQTDRLPPREIVEINTLCGHGLVSFNLIQKIIEEIKLERMTSRQGALYLAKPCECGVFNIHRAQDILERLRLHG